MAENKLKVVELFAGVGGFRLGLEKNNKFKVIWSNQWEPQTKTQHASIIYEDRFGSIGHSNEDIETIPTNEIPNHDLLCGGFPCQDYSVATTLKNSKGLINLMYSNRLNFNCLIIRSVRGCTGNKNIVLNFFPIFSKVLINR